MREDIQMKMVFGARIIGAILVLQGVLADVTDNGDRCYFPFEYNGKSYERCTSDGTTVGPWCYTDATGSSWGYCDYSAVENKVVSTTIGENCVFPFDYQGEMYTECTEASSPGKPWCYTASSWGVCVYGEVKEIATEGGTANGEMCKFPFDYGGETYMECTLEDSDKPWCYTASGWGNCKEEVVTKPKPCNSSPCQNDGECTDLDESNYKCECLSGYSGANCETAPLPCDSNPCLNAGTCSNTGASTYSCQCPTYYEGTDCEIHKPPPPPPPPPVVEEPQEEEPTEQQPQKDEPSSEKPEESRPQQVVVPPKPVIVIQKPCQSSPSPCQNGASCENLDNDNFKCTCAKGWTGRLCTQKIVLPCEKKDRCKNGGECTNVGERFFECKCKTGFIGMRCQKQQRGACDAKPCKNGATCVNVGNKYKCICPINFYSNKCERFNRKKLPGGKKPCDLAKNACQNNGICVDRSWQYSSCICQKEYEGNKCQKKKKLPCDSSPCKNEGFCFNKSIKLGRFGCRCPFGYRGPVCENKVV